MDLIGWITDTAASLPTPLVWALGLAFSFAESGLGLGFFMPGETLVLLLAATFDDVTPAVVFFLVVAVGGSAGDHVGYLLGRRFGAGFRNSKLIRRLGVDNWDRAVGILERRGAAAVFLTRLVPVIRTLTPAAAGVAGVPYRAFLPASFAGALTWSAVYAGIGFLLRSSLEAAQRYLGEASSWALVVVAVAIAVIIVVRLVRGRRAAARDAATADGGTAAESVAGSAEAASSRPWLTGELAARLADGGGWRTVANAVTVGRLLGAAVAGGLLVAGRTEAAAVVLVVTLLTDLVDGPIARRTGMVSVLGAWLDPVATRVGLLLVVGAFALSGIFGWQEVVLVVVPDLLLALGALMGYRGDPGVRVWWAGKLRTVLLGVGLVTLLIGATGGRDLSFVAGLGYLVFLVGLVFHYVASAHYGRVMLVRWQQGSTITR